MINQFLDRFGININPQKFKIVEQAFCHSSYLNENQSQFEMSNERLEFLGDAILQMITTEFIYLKFPHLREGDLTKIRSMIVREGSLAQFAIDISLDKLIKLGEGEKKQKGMCNPAILADCVEAVIAGIYLAADDNLFEVKKFLEDYIKDKIAKLDLEQLNDYKSRLQEFIQADSNRSIKYVEKACEQSDNNTTVFIFEVYVDDILYGRGKGTSKKRAQQKAAQSALLTLVK